MKLPPNLSELLAKPVHFSTLKHIGRSPAHYLHALAGGQKKQSLVMRLGSGTHALLFDEPYAVYVKEENKKAGKNTVRNGKHWEEFQAAHPRHAIVNEKEDAEARAMVAAIRDHSKARQLLLRKEAQREKYIEWSWCGRKCAGTPDLACNRSLDELKTSRSSDPDKFIRDARWMYYHAQLAWYRIGLRENGLDPQAFHIVSVENSAPYVPTVINVTHSTIEKGERIVRLWMERLRNCERNNYWPGYIDDRATFDWDINDEEAFDLDGLEDEEEEATGT